MTMMLSEMDSLLGVFSRAEQRVLQAILRAIAQDGGRCVATLAMLRPQRGRKQVNHPQRDQPGGRNRPSGKDRTPLLLRSLASQHFDDGAAPAPRWRRPSPLELPAARRSSSSAAQFGGIRLQGSALPVFVARSRSPQRVRCRAANEKKRRPFITEPARCTTQEKRSWRAARALSPSLASTQSRCTDEQRRRRI